MWFFRAIKSLLFVKPEKVRLFSRSCKGKSQICVEFKDGIKIIATEP